MAKNMRMTTYSPVMGMTGVPQTVSEKKRSLDSYMPGSFGSNSQHPGQKHLSQVQQMIPDSAKENAQVDTGGEVFPAWSMPSNIPDQFAD